MPNNEKQVNDVSLDNITSNVEINKHNTSIMFVNDSGSGQDSNCTDSSINSLELIETENQNSLNKITSDKSKTRKNQKVTFFTTKNIVRLAILSAISGVLYVFARFPLPLPFLPSFLDFHVSDVPALISGFFFGPLYPIIITVIKIIMKLAIQSTSSFGIGEVCDVLVSLAYCLPPALIYKHKKNTKSIIVGLTLGYILSTVVAMIANRFIIMPFYIKFVFGGWDNAVKMMRGIFPNITQQNFYFYYIFAAILPFNAIRGAASWLVAFFVVKSLGNRISV